MQATSRLETLLADDRGIIAVIGSGGKSTLLEIGGRALAQSGRHVALATSTHMYPPRGIALVDTLDDLDAELGRTGVAAIGTPGAASGKLSEPACGIPELARHADIVLVEADGSKRLPLKAHGSREPAVPSEAMRTILVVGANGFGQPIARVVHRPEVFCRLTGAEMGCPATPVLVARAIAAEGFVGAGDLVIVNQVEDAESAELARALGAELATCTDTITYAGSLRTNLLRRV